MSPERWPPERGASVQEILVNDPRLTHREIIAKSADWLRGVQKPQISRFQEYDIGGETVGVNLVCVPTSERNARMYVAAVPIRKIKARFTDELNEKGTGTNAILCDDAGTIMIGGGGALTGRDIGTLRDERIRTIAAKYLGKEQVGVETLEEPYTLANQQFPPGLMAIEPV